MKLEKDRLISEWFVYGRKMGWRYNLAAVGRRAPKLSDFLEDMDPNLGLDWSGYFYGPPLLRQQIVETQRYTAIPGENILTTSGTYEANFLAVMSLVEPGDEVVLEIPAWPQPIGLCRSQGAQLKFLWLKEENNWQPDLDDLARLVTPRTKLIFVNHPNNPTGSVVDPAQMQRICDIAARVGAYVLSDEIYRGLEWGERESGSAVNCYERGVSTSSVSKLLGLVGLRIGWLATQDRELLYRCWLLHRHSAMVTNILGEHLVTFAMQPDRYTNMVEAGKKDGQANLSILSRWFARSRFFTWVPPEGGYSSFPRIDPALGIDSWEFCARLLQEPYRTYMVPGLGYSDRLTHNVRLGFGSVRPVDTEKALTQVESFLTTLRR
jgi:aspartate/methionine/tyrosine aminotransferase